VRPSLDALRAFTLNELYIAPYDLRAFALFLQKASEDDEVEFVMGLLQGGPRWLRGLRELASELGVSYSPDLVSPEAVGYTHFLSWLALNGGVGELAVLVGVNFRTFCVNSTRLAEWAEGLGVRSAGFLRCVGLDEEREKLAEAIAERHVNMPMYRHVALVAQHYELSFWRSIARAAKQGALSGQG